MNILGIETSCDETAAAVVQDGVETRANLVSSQVAEHADYGGVVPELAAREHLVNIDYVIQTALKQSGMSIVDIDGVAVTTHPGLVPALLVGTSYARGIAAAGALPIVGINHFLAHIYSCFIHHPFLLEDAALYPLVALVVSGGHTVIILIEKEGDAIILGTTLDDAAGEAFDKAARILSLGYPGGPVIEKLAENGDEDYVRFPRGLTGEGGKPVSDENRFNFSFSGLKTSLLYKVKDRQPDTDEISNLTASYQRAIVEVLCRKTFSAAAQYDAPTVLVCGGVACNGRLQREFEETAEKKRQRLIIPPPSLCTDNAVMVAGLGYHYIRYAESPDTAVTVGARLGRRFDSLPFTPATGGSEEKGDSPE
ncbi:MAG: tRNA (adenosine(37)-N6)-threonylcarbamoyltransferase complex transferase subunit TsaD [Verrucomicrobiota bacterium]